MYQILEAVLKKLQPSQAETRRFQKAVSLFIKKINSRFKDAKAILGGSGEKDTWLAGSHDLDIFVLFDYKKYQNQSDLLSDLLQAELKKLFSKVTRLHGSRDYFQITYQHYLFEVVPILKISQASQALNITDISPLHAQWVKKAPKKIKEEIRLAKQFAQACSCYGAESYISGFSGYVLEILTIYYGSFANLLRAAFKWENKDVIDIENHYKTKSEIFKQINSSKLISPLIVVDPVDKTRNAAAALSLEKFLLFKQKAAEFLQKPDKKFFEKETLSFKEIEKQTRYNLVYLEIASLAGKEDVVGIKLLKAYQYLKKKLSNFSLQDAGWDWDKKNKAVFYFLLEKKQIAPFVLRLGPPLKMADAVKAFKRKNKTAFEAEGRMVVKLPFKAFQLKDYIKELIKDPYFKERIKQVKVTRFG